MLYYSRIIKDLKKEDIEITKELDEEIKALIKKTKEDRIQSLYQNDFVLNTIRNAKTKKIELKDGV